MPEKCSGKYSPKAVNSAFANEGKSPKQLVADNQRLVYQQADKLRNTIQPWDEEEFRDLIGAGFVGLSQAANRFDPSKGFRFSSLAVRWIRGEMLHYLRDRGKGLRVPRIWHDLYMKGYGLTDEQAAEKNSITLELWLEIKVACSIWVKPLEPIHDRAAPADLEADESPTLDRARAAIAQWLEQMPAGDRAIVQAIYFEGQPRKHHKKNLTSILETLPQITP